MVLGIGLIIKAIKKPLVAVKMILLFVIPLITFWGTTFLLDRGLDYFEGDKDIGLTMGNAGTAANPSKWRTDYDDQSTGGTRYASMRTVITHSRTSLKALVSMPNL